MSIVVAAGVLAGATADAQPTPWHLSAADIATQCRSAIDAARRDIAATLARTPADQRSFANTIQPIETAIATEQTVTGPLAFLYAVAPDQAVRDSSTDCSQRVANYTVEINADPNIYQAAVRASEHGDAATPADRQLVKLYVENGRRAGAGLDSAARARVAALFQRLNDLQQGYVAALASDSTRIELSAADTVGLSPQMRAGLTKASTGFLIPVSESDQRDFLSTERNSQVRHRFMVAYYNRGGAANVERLQQAILIRDSLAHALGFPTWAAYQLDGKMAKDPARVTQFLDSIDQRLLSRARTELAQLAPLAQHDHVAVPLTYWDYFYYEEQYKRTHFALDANVVRQYFPVDHVVPAVLTIYQELLGVRFTEVKPSNAWVGEVREFTVTDGQTGAPLGEFYLDLFPRPNKYENFAAVPFTPTFLRADGSRQPAAASIVGNWPRGEPGQPATLSHLQVIFFFHEFGHVMAALLDRSPYVTTGAGNVRQDFDEAPSLMLENWAWDPAVLKRISQRVGTGAPLSDAMIRQMIAVKHLRDGEDQSVETFLSLYDMTLHMSPPTIDVMKTWTDLFPRLTPFANIDGTLPAANFPHVMAGLDVGYYSYLWAHVYAADMFTRFTTGGVFNPTIGRAYRDDILARAATEEPDALVERFLGRQLSYNAFYRDVGITF